MATNETIAIFQSSIEIVVSSAASNNTCCAFIESAPPDGGPPPHRHAREEEIFTVLSGDFEFYADGVWSPLAVGETRLSLRGHYHAFRNVGSTTGRMLAVTNNGGIDDYFRLISGLRMPEDMAKLEEISRHYGYEFLLPPRG